MHKGAGAVASKPDSPWVTRPQPRVATTVDDAMSKANPVPLSIKVHEAQPCLRTPVRDGGSDNNRFAHGASATKPPHRFAIP